MRKASGSAALVVLVLALAGCAVLGSRGVVITWKVESEQGTAGYNVLRAESADGPFTQVNKALIAATGDPVVSKEYSYTDNDVECGKTYWYKLQEVEVSGAVNAIPDKVTQVTACR